MLESAESINTKFSFRRCTFKENVEFNIPDGKFNNLIVFDSTIHSKWLKFDGTFNERIFIRDIKFLNYPTIEFTGPLDNKTFFKDIVLLDLNETIENISFIGIRISQLAIKNIGGIDTITISNSEIQNKFSILDIEDIKHLKIANLDLMENSKILSENINVKNLELLKISQDAKYIQFHHINILETFVCKRVELKNTYFNDFDISKSNKTIEKTSFIDSHLNSIKWGNISKIIAERDTFRQLKFVNDNQGNHIEANNFYVMEMKKYQNDILDKQSWFSNFWQEKIIFSLGKKLSNFGQSWFLPFLWIIIFNLASITYINLINTPNINIVYVCLILLCTWVFAGRLPYELYKNDSRSLYPMQHLSIVFGLSFITYIFGFGSLNDIAIFTNIKIPKAHELYKDFLYIWLLNKIITGFILYHLIISLRRQTRR